MSADDVDIAIAKSIAEDDGEVVVGCLPITQEPAVPSISHSCAECGALIWVSARVMAALPESGKLICLHCVAGNGRLN